MLKVETAGRIPAEFLVPLLGNPSEDISTTVTPPFRYLACCPPPGLGVANRIVKDRAAVDAALTMRWSTSMVEGHIHRAKLIKRQGYGHSSSAWPAHHRLCTR
jgi:hypothetical protein